MCSILECCSLILVVAIAIVIRVLYDEYSLLTDLT